MTEGGVDMMDLQRSDGGRLAWRESGAGGYVVLVHGSPGDGRAWARVSAHLDGRVREIAPDLPGYGASDPPVGETTARIRPMAAAVVDLIDTLPAPVRLVGHSNGANVALFAALERPRALSRLLLLEPVFVKALPLAGRHETYAAFEAYFRDYLARADAGEEAAIRLMVDYWFGAGAWAGMPAQVQDFLQAAQADNVADVKDGFTLDVTREELAGFTVPTTIAVGGASPPVTHEIAESLAGLLGAAGLAEVPGATHGMLDSHASDVAELILETLEIGGEPK